MPSARARPTSIRQPASGSKPAVPESRPRRRQGPGQPTTRARSTDCRPLGAAHGRSWPRRKASGRRERRGGSRQTVCRACSVRSVLFPRLIRALRIVAVDRHQGGAFNYFTDTQESTLLCCGSSPSLLPLPLLHACCSVLVVVRTRQPVTSYTKEPTAHPEYIRDP